MYRRQNPPHGASEARANETSLERQYDTCTTKTRNQRALCWANAPRWRGRQRCWPTDSHHPKPTWACLWCRPSPEFACPSVWVLGWSTRYLCTNNPTSCARNTKLYRCSSTFLHFRRSTASSCHSGTCSSLNGGLTRRTSLRSTAASATTEAVSSLNSTSSHCPSSSTPLPQLLLVVCTAWMPVWFVDARGCFAGRSDCVCCCRGGGRGCLGGGDTAGLWQFSCALGQGGCSTPDSPKDKPL
jgi:hypothetical protein